jgi:transposase
MSKQVKARAVQDPQEERKVRKLARSLNAPADWKFHAQTVVLSWAGKTPNEIAAELGCHAQTVRIHLRRFNAEGIAGLGMRPGAGRKPRLTEQERSRILALAKQEPPGHLSAQTDGAMVARDEEGSAQWSLNALTQAAHEAGIAVKRSQIRRIYLREGVRWRRTHSWGTSDDPDFVPKGPRSSATTPSHTRGRRVFLTFQVLLDSVPQLSTQKLTISTCFMAPRDAASRAAGPSVA